MTYVATALAGDEEMVRRIAIHRGRRPASWRTVEEPWDLEVAAASHRGEGTLLIDCLTLWITNRLVGLPNRPAETDSAMEEAVGELVRALAAADGRAVVVSNEVGCGIVPANALARRFGDLVGAANQRLAEAANEVYWCVAGLPQQIKVDKDTGHGR